MNEDRQRAASLHVPGRTHQGSMIVRIWTPSVGPFEPHAILRHTQAIARWMTAFSGWQSLGVFPRSWTGSKPAGDVPYRAEDVFAVTSRACHSLRLRTRM